MLELLINLQLILAGALGQAGDKTFNLVEVKTDLEFAENFSIADLPALLIADQGFTSVEGPVSNAMTRTYKVKIRLLQQAMHPPTARINEQIGVLALLKKVEATLLDNKQVNGAATGMLANIDAVSVQLDQQVRDKFELVAVGYDLFIDYVDEFIPFHGRRNNESQTIAQLEQTRQLIGG